MKLSARPSRRALAITAATATALALAVLPAGAALAGQPAAKCDNRNNNTISKLTECVTASGVMEHLDAFQSIADANGGTRAVLTPGYEASVDYVVDTLTAAGWQVHTEPFDYFVPGISELEQLTPVQTDWENEAPAGAGVGEVSGTIIPVDLVLGQPNGTAVTSGCEPEDFLGLDFSGDADIALVQRGTCEFGVKAANAQTAGAEAVIIMNQGNTPERSGVLTNITLIGENPDPLGIPVVGTSYEAGAALAAGSTARVLVPEPTKNVLENVIAELPGTNPDNVVMAGAHLDSVPAGPGINDNGSGSAALLELAESMSKVKPQNTVRLAWWGAEEEGLIGSTYYVDEPASGRARQASRCTSTSTWSHRRTTSS